MSKHKHADLIHAWADGAEIQYYAQDKWWNCREAPQWHEDIEYRIKPAELEEKKPVVRWLWLDPVSRKICDTFVSEEELKNCDWDRFYTVKLEWSRTEFPE